MRSRLRSRRRCALAAFTIGASALAVHADITACLSASTSPTRADAVDLDGAAFNAGDDLYIFVDTILDAARVDFYLNGRFVGSDARAPFDLAGNAGHGPNAAPDTFLRDGENTAAAVIITDDEWRLLTAEFTRPGEARILEIADEAGFSILSQAVDAAGLTGVLSGDGPFTVFAPSDDAFIELLGALDLSASELLSNTELLTDVLLYHVVFDDLNGADVVAQGVIDTANGASVLAGQIGDDVVINGDVTVTLPNVDAANGTIHAIDTVLLPPDVLGVADNAGFGTLLAAVDAAGLTDALGADGPFTVFAPTEQAFADLLAALDVTAPELLADVELLDRVLKYHVVPGALDASDVIANAPLTTLLGSTINVRVEDGGVVLNDDVNVAIANVRATNGIVHVIDQVLIPQPTILEVAEQGGFATLVAAVEAAGLADTLNSAGPFTVFAPTEQAFGELLEALDVTAPELLADTDLLTRVLLYHVVPGSFDRDGVVAAGSLTTAQGSPVEAATVGSSVVLNGEINVLVPNVPASNGIVHVIDGVLLPPPNIPQLAADAGLATLVAAVEAAGLTETLNGEGPFTVFAPTEQAFADLLEALDVTAPELLADTALLTDVLLYHVVPGRLDGAAVLESSPLATFQGDTINAKLVGSEIVLNETITVELGNVQAGNGIVHVIDGVLLPTMTMEPGIGFSTSANRSDPQPLDGATVPDGPVSIFLTPLFDSDVQLSIFFVNNRFAGVDGFAPFDAGGTNPDGSAPLINLREGANDAVAITVGASGFQIFFATFERR